MKTLRKALATVTATTLLSLLCSGTAVAEQSTAEYVSLGDSFASVGSAAETTVSSSCVQSRDNVGHLVSERMPGVSFADLACGNTSTELVNTMSSQLSGNTRYVSISTGGNDGDLFLDLISSCLLNAWTCTPQVRHDAERKVDRLGDILDDTYAQVRQAAPNAQIVTLGYLPIAPSKFSGCQRVPTLTADTTAFMYDIQNRLNEQVARASHRAGLTMVTPEQEDERSICGPPGSRYVSFTGFGPGDDGLPVHPTRAGREHSASLLYSAFTGR